LISCVHCAQTSPGIAGEVFSFKGRGRARGRLSDRGESGVGNELSCGPECL